MENQKYKELQIDFSISNELKAAINAFLFHINNEDGKSEDCYRSEIDFWLKDCRHSLTDSQFALLREYYVFGGIYGQNS